MKPDNYDARLADYLGGEMSPGERTAFEAALETAPECQAEAAALQAALADLRRLPACTAAGVALPPGPPRRRRGPVGTLLKAAAVLAFGVFIGRFTAPTAGEPTALPGQDHAATTPRSQSRGASAESTIQVAAIHPAWIEFGRKLRASSTSLGVPLDVPLNAAQ